MKNTALFILTLVVGGALFGCSTTKRSGAVYGYQQGIEYGYEEGSGYRYQQSLEPESAARLFGVNAEENYDAVRIEKKILFSASLSLIVKNPDSANYHIQKIAEKYKGYINQTGTYRAVIRVKSEYLNEAVNDISGLGKVQAKNLTGQDVTEEYSDYKIRLENAVKSRERYLELLAKAENVEAALQVEKELERLNGTIDILKGKMNRIDHLSEYSTITVNLKEKKKPGILGYVGMGLYYSVKWLFIRN